jgi:glycosyltransferase involved in cell wall biosynthesis
MQGVSEGFGLQPMEALACGCVVFSSVNGGLSDYLDPGFNCYKIAGYSREYDVKRILKMVNKGDNLSLSEEVLKEYRRENVVKRFGVILEEINEFFDVKYAGDNVIPALPKMGRFRLFADKVVKKFGKKYFN